MIPILIAFFMLYFAVFIMLYMGTKYFIVEMFGIIIATMNLAEFVGLEEAYIDYFEIPPELINFLRGMN